MRHFVVKVKDSAWYWTDARTLERNGFSRRPSVPVPVPLSHILQFAARHDFWADNSDNHPA
jgi:hypothetical protein